MNNVQLYQPPAQAIPQSAINAQFNQQMARALASGDPRQNVKQYDRPGMSRGGAQWNQAGIDSARNLAEGVSDAYTSRINAQAYNANANLQANVGHEQYAQALGGLQQQDAYAAQMAALQQQQAWLGIGTGLLRGLMN